MLATIHDKGCDVAAAYRTTREGEPPIRSWFANKFYSLINGIANIDIKNGARDFRVMRRRVVRTIVDMPERTRFSKGIFAWVGFDTEWIAYENIERESGGTGWSFWQLVRYAIDGLVAFSTWPLEMVSLVGLITCILAVLGIVFLVLRYALFGDPVPGWPSMMCVIVFLGGVVLLSIGIIGLYVAKIYTEVKRRPLYVIEDEA